jgi:hypothetical protein
VHLLDLVIDLGDDAIVLFGGMMSDMVLDALRGFKGD